MPGEALRRSHTMPGEALRRSHTMPGEALRRSHTMPGEALRRSHTMPGEALRRRFLLTLALAAPFLPLRSASLDAWESFKRQHQRAYTPEQESFRRQVFLYNLDIIERHNAEHDAGRSTYRLGVNQFADLTNSEFRLLLLTEARSTPAVSDHAGPHYARTNRTQPDHFDWRDQGVPIPIKDQGAMGAAWAIHVTTAVESGLIIAGEAALALSQHNLTDCVAFHSFTPTAVALDRVHRYGMASEADYPASRPCPADLPMAATADHVHTVPAGDATALLDGVLQNPVPVTLDAGHISFQLYAGGIYSERHCSQTQYDHVMLAAGYGAEGGNQFWLLANSWGTMWGEAGFMKMKRGVNMCGVASNAVFPTGVHTL
ncbi:procathepsin L-like [Pollicipes pollicipes]|uniref:procathepsin L-like n=1 Tax=Pollicipes pollicipes TaxID=41117 RepID=UPI001884FE42|nr:procathepsin L-like [Pollicipes pollicipes]